MTATAFNHPLDTLRDGVVGFGDAKRLPIPLTGMKFDVIVDRGMATIAMTRTFRNSEPVPIEAILTFPVPFDAVMTGLTARVDGRVLHASAKARDTARDDYEEALDRGKMAVLHEEALRGVHILSIGQLAPGKDVEILCELMAPLAQMPSGPFLRIPTTVGQLYGASPLMPADDITTSADALAEALLTVTTDKGPAVLAGEPVGEAGRTIGLDRSIDLTFPNADFGTLEGVDAYGRAVRLSMNALEPGSRALNVAILFDRSGSTASPLGTTTVWAAMKDALASSLDALRADDVVTLFEFSDEANRLGAARGPAARDLVRKLGEPDGGTELESAVDTVSADDAPDILVLTDGETWSVATHNAARHGRRVSAVLVGQDSFDAMIGQLAAMTGGQLFAADGDNVSRALQAALASIRRPACQTEYRTVDGKPASVTTARAGVKIQASWEAGGGARPLNNIGRYAAALALPSMALEAAMQFAIDHGLCSHLTSLVLVDETGATSEGLSETRKIPLLLDSLRPHAAAASAYRSSVGDLYKRVRRPQALQDSLNNERYLREDAFVSPFALANLIDWNLHANALLSGNLDGLPQDHADQIRDISTMTSVEMLADQTGQPVVLVAIALLAAVAAGYATAFLGEIRVASEGNFKPRDKTAYRLFLKILKSASQELLNLSLQQMEQS